MPFRTKYSLFRADGTINNCLDDDGHLLSRDRYLWSQGRALWTFSALYNRIEKRSEWLDVAHGLFRYLCSNGRDSHGRWVYRLDADGKVLEGDISIYVDGFVMNGLGEYFQATGDKRAAELSEQTYENVRARIATPGSYGISPYVLPQGMKTLGIPMIFSYFFHGLGKALGRDDICQGGYEYAKEVIRDFLDADKNVFREFVSLDG